MIPFLSSLSPSLRRLPNMGAAPTAPMQPAAPPIRAQAPQIPPQQPSPTMPEPVAPLPRMASAPANMPRAGMGPMSNAPVPTNDGMIDGQLRARAPLPMPDIPQLPGHYGDPIRDNPRDRARRDHVMAIAERNPDGTLAGDKIKFKRNWKDIGLNALMGFVQGAQSNPRDPLMAGLGGAATAGIVTGVSPQAGREYQFDTAYAPEFEQRQAEEQKQAETGRKARMSDLQIAELESQVRTNAARELLYQRQAKAPTEVSRGASIYDEKNQYIGTAPWTAGQSPEARPRRYTINGKLVDDDGNVLFDAGTKEPPLTELTRRAEADLDAEEGTASDIALSSTEARRPEVIAQAPEPLRSLLTTGKMPDGSDAYTEDITRAQAWLDGQMRTIAQQNEIYTKGVRRRAVADRARGGSGAAKPAPKVTSSRGGGGNRPSTAPRNVNDLLPLLNQK